MNFQKDGKYLTLSSGILRSLHSFARVSHTFDGVTPSKETAAFQLCDITDPMIKAMIDDPEEVRDVCNVNLPSTQLFYHAMLTSPTGTRRLVHNSPARTHQDSPAPQVLLATGRARRHGRGMREALCGDAGGIEEGEQACTQTRTPQYG